MIMTDDSQYLVLNVIRKLAVVLFLKNMFSLKLLSALLNILPFVTFAEINTDRIRPEFKVLQVPRAMDTADDSIEFYLVPDPL